jgi:DNA-binding transcriptional regulator LsrR (DeoR family)
MESIEIDILDPKAERLLKNLADMNLIKITSKKTKTDFSALLNKLRSKPTGEISLKEITAEVEAVRSKRHEKK